MEGKNNNYPNSGPGESSLHLGWLWGQETSGVVVKAYRLRIWWRLEGWV